jgi:hypothetical protein
MKADDEISFIWQLQSSIINMVHIVEVLCAGAVPVDVLYVPFPMLGV